MKTICDQNFYKPFELLLRELCKCIADYGLRKALCASGPSAYCDEGFDLCELRLFCALWYYRYRIDEL